MLGNHHTIYMVPRLEEMGFRMLLNECEPISRGSDRIYLAGIDDAHYYQWITSKRVWRIFRMTHFQFFFRIPRRSIANNHADFNLLFSGHTHGGQICLPGSVPITLSSVLPRHMGSGPWTYHHMAGYTSVGAGSSIVPVRINCLPEITLHHLN